MYVWACESNVGDIEYVRAAFFSTLNRSESWSDCFHSIDFLFVICSHHFSTTNWNIWFMIGKKIYLHLFVKIRQWPKVKESRRIEIHWETENLAALHLDRWLLSLGIFFRYSDFLWFNVCIFFYIELDNSYALIQFTLFFSCSFDLIIFFYRCEWELSHLFRFNCRNFKSLSTFQMIVCNLYKCASASHIYVFSRLILNKDGNFTLRTAHTTEDEKILWNCRESTTY